MANTNSSLLRSFIWKSLERFSVVVIQFIIQLILIRLLKPEDYGAFAVGAAIIAILNVILQAGVVKSLVQFKHINSNYFSTAFYTNFIFSIILYGALFLLAPVLQKLTDVNGFVPLIRVLGLSLIIGVFNTIQETYIIRRAKFKKIFVANTFAVIASGIVGIICAVNAMNFWALVFQQLTNLTVCSIVLFLQSGYRVKLYFSFKKTRLMLKYSWKFTLSFLLEASYLNIQSIAIGRLFNTRMLGFITKGQQFPQLIVVNVDSIIQSVMLRNLALRQDCIEDIRVTIKRVSIVSAFLLFPILTALIINSESIILVLFSERWLPSRDFLIIYTLAYMFVPFNSLNIQVPNALGKSNIYLRNEIIKKTIGVLFLVVLLPFGLKLFFYGLIFYGFCCFVVDTVTTGMLIDYGFVLQLRDIFPYAFLSLVVGLINYPIRFLTVGPVISVFLSLVLSGTLYLVASWFFRLEGFRYVRDIIKRPNSF